MKYVFLIAIVLVIVILAVVFICTDGIQKNKQKIRDTRYNHIWVLRDLIDKICTYHEENNLTESNPLYNFCCIFVGEQQDNFREAFKRLGWAQIAEGEFNEEFFTLYYYYRIIDAYEETIEKIGSLNYSYRNDIKKIIEKWKEEQETKIDMYITGENPAKTVQL